MKSRLWLCSVAVVAAHAFLARDQYDDSAAEAKLIPRTDLTSFLQEAKRINQQASQATISTEDGVADVSKPSQRWPSLAQFLSYRPSLAHFLSLLSAPPKIPSHPFPSLEWSEVKFPAVLICVAVLFMAGVLCSAGGIGGGGVYVTVLMVAGSLSPHDAVPLSKAVVFCGSLSSLVLNLRRSLTPAENGQAKTIIDYNICRLIVPSALFGTLMGVVLNSQIAPWLIVAMLAGILLMMTWMSGKEFYKHYYTEEGTGNGNSVPTPNSAMDFCAKYSPRQQKSLLTKKASADAERSASSRGSLCQGECLAAFMLLVFVICCGALRAHANACQMDLVEDASNMYGRDACERPVIKSFLGSALVTWMSPESRFMSNVLLYGTVFLPMSICLGIAISYGLNLVSREQWLMKEVVLYCTMAVLTGCFAGLVGIGGGLVFSPFILWMTGDPAVAVATSSTCVIFTSSSTTFQYLFTDRITMSLTIIYGIVNLVASYVGTKTVHMLDTLKNRKTLISGIVLLGVIASVCLSVYKLVSMGVSAH